jgi:hypothetical protein
LSRNDIYTSTVRPLYTKVITNFYKTMVVNSFISVNIDL